MTNLTPDDVHALSGAYALDALSPEEAARFREHLRGCDVCRDEVSELQEAAARMGAIEAFTPPAELRDRIMAGAARTPQHPPVVSMIHEHRPRGRMLLAAAAAVLVALVGGVAGIRALSTPDSTLVAAAERVFEAEDARTVAVDTANGGRLVVGVSRDRGEMAVDTRELPDPGQGRVYQIWSVHDDVMVSAAILVDPESGAAMGLPDEDTGVAITIEPAGGSEQPTGTPIAQLDPAEV